MLLLALLATVLAALPASRAEAAPADLVPPATIKVCRSDGSIDTVGFKDYVKTVLPREFPSSWPMETIKAGAVAVKSYAWYYVDHPWRAECHLSDTTRHQKYDPEDRNNPPTAKTNAAVEETWHLRMEEDGHVAYAQYCNCSWFPAGEHIQQSEARDLAEQGWNHLQILAHSYRNMSNFRLFDWRVGFGLDVRGPGPYPLEDDQPLQLTAAVTGVRAGDPDAPISLYAACTMSGTFAWHLVQRVVTTTQDGAVVAAFDRTDPIRACEQDQITARVELEVNGYRLLHRDVAVWRPWQSSSSREVQRIAESDDPTVASILLSGRMFDERQTPQATTTDGSLDLTSEETQSPQETRQAASVVLARSDEFPDSLSATGLAGTQSPILLNPGGPDATLRDDVRAEVDRVLGTGDTVHIVGGTAALPESVETELRDAGYQVKRHAGPSRVDTALAVAQAIRDRGGETSTVLVARAYGTGSAAWADAVAGGPFAAAMGHPVLLTSDTTLMAEVEAWIEDDANGVTEAVLLGGQAAVPSDAEQRLDVAVTRVAGPTRAHTATAIADQLWTRADAPTVEGAMLVDGYDAKDWPYALAASVYAARIGSPQLLVRRLIPNYSTGAWLESESGLPVTIVGSTTVLPARLDSDASGPAT